MNRESNYNYRNNGGRDIPIQRLHKKLSGEVKGDRKSESFDASFFF